jgi:hypothetical protein
MWFDACFRQCFGSESVSMRIRIQLLGQCRSGCESGSGSRSMALMTKNLGSGSPFQMRIRPIKINEDPDPKQWFQFRPVVNATGEAYKKSRYVSCQALLTNADRKGKRNLYTNMVGSVPLDFQLYILSR